MKTLSKVVVAVSLLLSLSAFSAEKLDVKAETALMVEQSTLQVNHQLSKQLNNDIQLAVMMKLPTVVNKEGYETTLLAKNVTKEENKSNNNADSE